MNRVIHILKKISYPAIDHPVRAWVVAIALMAFSVFAAVSRIEFKTSNLDLVDPDVPVIHDFTSFAEAFGTPNVLIVVLEGHDAAALQQAADRVAPSLKECPGVRNVVYKVPLDDEWLRELGMESYSMSDDHGSLYLFVQPDDVRSSASEIEPLVREVRRVLDGALLEADGVRAGLTGIPEYAVNDKDFIQNDIKKLSLFALLGVLAVFAVGFRSWREPLVACASLLAGCVITLGVVSFAPGHLTLLSASFVSILFGLGIDYGVHLSKRIEEFLAMGREPRDAVREGLDRMFGSLFTGALTTATVFIAMRYSGLKGFSELGLVAGIGVLVCFLCMITLLPAGIMMIRPRMRPAAPVPAALSNGVRRGWAVTAVFSVLVIWAAVSPVPGFDSDYLALQPVDSEAARLERAMIDGSGYSPQFAAFVFESENKAVDFADRLLDEALVGEVRTLAGIGDLGLPDEDVEALTAVLGPQFISEDGRFAVYAYPSENVWKPDAQERFVATMKALDASVTGMPIIGQYMFEVSERALERMSLIALGVLAVILLFDFRSLRLTAAALAPTLLTFLLMRLWMDVGHLAYNPINIMALPVILGIAVDDGVHVVHRFRQEGGNMPATLWGTGRTVIITSLTSMISFGALAFGAHRGLASFGLLLFIGVATALVVSLGWLPWLLHRFAPFWLKEARRREL